MEVSAWSTAPAAPARCGGPAISSRDKRPPGPCPALPGQGQGWGGHNGRRRCSLELPPGGECEAGADSAPCRVRAAPGRDQPRRAPDRFAVPQAGTR
eukprot:scaffold6912_cov202-Prasinococcus_capsulatus_cf.AAC.1